MKFLANGDAALIFKLTHYVNIIRESLSATLPLVIDYGSREMAKKGVQDKSYLGGGARVVQQEDWRSVASDPYNGGTIIAVALVQRVVQVATKSPQDAIEFENSLPYAALGVSCPPVRSAAGVNEVIQALSLLDEFKRDNVAATKKYDGKTLRFTGTVAGTGKTSDGAPFIALQKEGEKPGLDSTLSCSFQPSEAAKVAALKKGQDVWFSGRVSYDEQIGFRVLLNCKLEEQPR